MLKVVVAVVFVALAVVILEANGSNVHARANQPCTSESDCVDVTCKEGHAHCDITDHNQAHGHCKCHLTSNACSSSTDCADTHCSSGSPTCDTTHGHGHCVCGV